MGVRDVLRKATGFLIELPPEEEESKPELAQPSGVREALRKATGLLIQLEPEEPARVQGWTAAPELPSVPQARMADPDSGRSDPAIAVSPATAPPVMAIAPPPIAAIAATAPPTLTAPSGAIDFDAIYQQANLPAVSFTAEKLLEFLASLPPEAPQDMKRLTVKAMLGELGKATGATTEYIIADASRKITALAGHVDYLSRQTTDFVASATVEIDALRAQIEEKRQSIETAQQQAAQATQACRNEAGRLDVALKFFGLSAPQAGSAAPGEAESPVP